MSTPSPLEGEGWGEGFIKRQKNHCFLDFLCLNPGTVVPLGAPGSINMLPQPQKTTRAHYPDGLAPKGQAIRPLPQGER